MNIIEHHIPLSKISNNKGKVSIRWRKKSASWCVYLRGKLFLSGFKNESAAETGLESRYPNLYNWYYEQCNN